MIVLVLALVLGLAFAVSRLFSGKGGDKETEGTGVVASEANDQSMDIPEETEETEPQTDERADGIRDAERLAAMYDYDGAIELLSSIPGSGEDTEIQELVAAYEETKAGLVRQDINTITHVFFHSLIVDPENALDKERWGTQADGYNSVMTTISEFEKMLEEFYQDGFVLVRLHDMAHIEKTADGEEIMVEGDIMLPEGKKAMVMSQDDVCYYEYMEGA